MVGESKERRGVVVIRLRNEQIYENCSEEKSSEWGVVGMGAQPWRRSGVGKKRKKFEGMVKRGEFTES